MGKRNRKKHEAGGFAKLEKIPEDCICHETVHGKNYVTQKAAIGMTDGGRLTREFNERVAESELQRMIDENKDGGGDV